MKLRLSALIVAAALLLGPAHTTQARVTPAQELVPAASGRAPLTQAGVDRVVELYEWALAVTFTPAERETFRDYFVGAWRRGDRSAATLLRMAEKVLAFDGAKREKIQPEFREAFLADFNSAPDSETNRFLLGVYRRGQGGGGTAEPAAAARMEEGVGAGEEPQTKTGGEPDFKPVAGALRMSELAGTWEKAGVSSYGYRDRVSNDYRSGYGSAQMHEVRADGSFDYSNYATVSLYDCTTELFTSMKGRVTLSGARVTFTYVSGTVKGKDSCKATGFNKPAQISSKTYAAERDGDRLRLCEVGAENPTCLYQTKR